MSRLDVVLLVYGCGVVLDFVDSLIRFPRFSFGRKVMFAVGWPVAVLLRIWRKIMG